MSLLDSTQLQLMVWLLRFAKKEIGGELGGFQTKDFRGARSTLHAAGLSAMVHTLAPTILAVCRSSSSRDAASLLVNKT